MNSSAIPAQNTTRLRARSSRVLWLVLAAAVLLFMLAAAPQRYAMLRGDAYGFGTAVTGLGLSYATFALYFTGLELFVGATCLLVASLIAWRRPGEPAMFFFAAALGSFVFLLPLYDGLSTANPAWEPLIVILRVLASSGFFAMLCLFPDGRFVPSWSRWYLVAWGVFVILRWPALSTFLAGTAIIPETRTAADGLALVIMAAWAVMGLLFQIIRYRSYASAEQRQQTKWVLFGLFVVAGAALINGLLLTLIPTLREDPRQNLLFTLSMGSVLLLGAVVLALTVALAILRYRLWDIDILLNRTLVYGGLTALITVAYVLLVGGVGALSHGNAGFVAGTALATAVVILLLRPLARRWQTAVDRLVPVSAPPLAEPAREEAGRATPPSIPLRPLWWAIGLLTVALFVAGLAAGRAAGVGWLSLAQDWPAGGPLLLQPVLRLDPALARLLMIGSGVQAVVFSAIGLFLYARKPREPMVVLASLMLITVGIGFTPPVVLLPLLRPAWHIPATVFQALMFGAVILFLYLFPNGRFYPAWTRAAALLWAVYAATWLLWPQLNPHRSTTVWPVVVWSAWVGSGILAQLLRFRGGATAVEKQQAKWVIVGFVVANLALVFLVAGEVGGSAPDASGWLAQGRAALLGLGTLLIALTVAVALLRYRLWDIDLVINRSLVYGGLTAAVIAAYVLLVGSLSALFQSRNNLLVSLLITGLIAVLFQPLRDHLQRAVNRLMFGQRDDPFGLLAALGRQLGAAGVPEDNLQAITRSICEALKLPYAAVELAIADGRKTAATCGAVQPGAEWPLVYQGELVGWLVAAPRAPGEQFGAKEQHLLETIAAQAGAAAYAMRLNRALQRSRERLVLAREEERRRLRRDLHDGLGPALASQTFALEAALEKLEVDPQAARDLLIGLKGRNRQLVADIRRLVYELRPPALDQLGLTSAAAAFLEQISGPAAPQIVLIADPDPLPPLPAAVEVSAYFIVREAVTNVLRHAQARHGRVELLASAAALTVRISDDGLGLNPEQLSGVGLQSMRERAEELGGPFTTAGRPGGGTVITAVLPLPPVGADR